MHTKPERKPRARATQHTAAVCVSERNGMLAIYPRPFTVFYSESIINLFALRALFIPIWLWRMRVRATADLSHSIEASEQIFAFRHKGKMQRSRRRSAVC